MIRFHLLPLAVLLILTSLAGCSGRMGASMPKPETIHSGDTVLLHYTCRTGDGRVATTTDQKIIENENARKARFFARSNVGGPVRVTAGQGERQQTGGDLRSFEGEVRSLLADRIVGRPLDETFDTLLDAETNARLDDDNRFLSIPSYRKVPRTRTIKRSDFVRGENHEPAVGQRLSREGFTDYAEVVSVDDETVTLKTLAVPDQRLETPWGPARIQIEGDAVHTVIEAEVGTVVRTGMFLGRIAAVDDRRITIDYADPFGGKTLQCRVTPMAFETGGTKLPQAAVSIEE